MKFFRKPQPREASKPAVDPIDEAVEAMRQATSKVRMDFGRERAQPERVTLGVIQELIRQNPVRMGNAVKRWLRSS